MNKDFKEDMKKVITAISQALSEIIKIIPNIIKGGFKALSKRLRFSITFKTTAIHTFFLALSLIFNTILIVGGIFGLLVYQDYNFMSKNIEIISRDIEKNNNTISEETLNNLSKDYGFNISIFNKDKKIYFTTMDNKGAAVLHRDNNGFNLTQQDSEPIAYLENRAALSDEVYYIQLDKSMLPYMKILGIALSVVASLNLLLIITSALRLSRTTKKMLKPIDNMTQTARSISANELDRRLDVVESHDELKDLAETFNEMLDRLEKSYEKQNQFVSDASHELRTPIAVIQGYANMLNRWGKEDKAILEESITAISSEAQNMKDLVEKLLFLARADKNTQKVQKEEFSLKDLIDEVLRETRMIDEKHLFLCDRNDEVIICADRTLIKQALRIFIDNSIKYTPDNGLIKLNSINNYNGVIIEVQDNGIGISEEELPKIFDRFYRCDKARSRQMGGTGLGLSIAKWIIGKHNGLIEVESALKGGTKFIISLPYK